MCYIGPLVMPWVSYSLCFFQAEDGIRDDLVTGVQTCALPICNRLDLGRVLNSPANQNTTKVQAIAHGDRIELQSTDANRDRKSVVVGKECRSRWSPYH